MKLVVLFLGLTALAAALSVPIMTEGWEMGPGPQLLNPEVLDTGAITCQECNKRFRRCVETAFVYGLPACESICATRVKQQDEVCKNCGWCDECDSETYHNFTLAKPPIVHNKPQRKML